MEECGMLDVRSLRVAVDWTDRMLYDCRGCRVLRGRVLVWCGG
jgi:hypothetical protein